MKNYLNLLPIKQLSFMGTCLMTLFIVSCNSDSDDLVTPQPKQPDVVAETVDVSLGFVGDPISISENPLTRADSKKKIYGINVYYSEGDNGSYQHYAYGLFDNVEDMKISLISNYTYKFECTIVQDDLDELYVYSGGYYGSPFSNGNSYEYQKTKLENKFIVSTTSSDHLIQMKEGTSRIKEGPGVYPRTIRLYGELEGYKPTNGGTAVINMKRTVFGAKFVVTPPADGSLEVSVNYLFGTIVKAGDSEFSQEAIYTFNNVYDCWLQQEDRTLDFDLNLTWNRANGVTQTFSKTLTMKRNVMTTVNISVSGSTTGESSVGFNEENTAMSNTTVNVSFNGGSQDDNNVNPNY